ncbi:MAG TPA: DUF2085 domain-containing protein [Thermoanaerobaculia bacterium]|nr:DUF2085 domain-containing protein [Thermoanaerobaculia bacterium]
MSRTFAVVLTSAGLLWAVLILATPRWSSLPGPPSIAAATVYASASRICHQRPERSFHAGGVPLPVCGRCAGLYLSGALGALLAWAPLRRRRLSGADRLLLAAAALPTAVTWTLEVVFGLAVFANETRAAAALPLGLAAGWVFVRGLRRDAADRSDASRVARPGAISWRN